MAQDTRINLQINVTGPTNLNPVVSSIKRAVQGINAGAALNVNPASVRNTAAVAAAVTNLRGQLSGTIAAANQLNQALGGAGRVSTSGFRQLQAQLGQVSAQLGTTAGAAKAATSEMYRFGQQAALSGRRMLAFGLGAISFIKVASAVREATKEAFDFERQMVRISQLGAVSTREINDIAGTIDKLSRNLGVSSKELADTTIYLKGAGLSIKEVNSALDALAKTSLAPTFKDIRSTTEGLLALRAQFKLTAGDYEKSLGAINAVAKDFAVESEDIIEAVRRAGSSFRAAAGDLDPLDKQLHQFIGLFTSVRATTRESAESISTSFRTIAARLQSNDVIKSLKGLGVNLRYTKEEAVSLGKDIEGQFVGLYPAIGRLSKALKDIPTNDPRFASVVQLAGGTRQMSKVIPLLKEFETAQKAASAAQAGQTSLTRDADKAQAAFTQKMSKLREEFLSLAREVQQSGFMQKFLDALIEGAKAATQMARALTPLIPLITTVATVRIGAGAFQFARGFANPPALPHFRARGFAGGGVVPQGFPNDTFYTQVPAHSFVIRAPVARRLSAPMKHSLASGGGGRPTVPVALTSEEIVVPPQQVNRMGRARLDAINAGHYRPRPRRSFAPVLEGARLEDRFLREYFASGVESFIIGHHTRGGVVPQAVQLQAAIGPMQIVAKRRAASPFTHFLHRASGGDTPNPVDLYKLYLSRRHNNAGRARRYSLDDARMKWYARHRMARFGRAAELGMFGRHAEEFEGRMAKYADRKHLVSQFAVGGLVVAPRLSRYTIDEIRQHIAESRDPRMALAMKMKRLATRGGHANIGEMMVALRERMTGGAPVGFGAFELGGDADKPKRRLKIGSKDATAQAVGGSLMQKVRTSEQMRAIAEREREARAATVNPEILSSHTAEQEQRYAALRAKHGFDMSEYDFHNILANDPAHRDLVTQQPRQSFHAATMATTVSQSMPQSAGATLPDYSNRPTPLHLEGSPADHTQLYHYFHDAAKRAGKTIPQLHSALAGDPFLAHLAPEKTSPMRSHREIESVLYPEGAKDYRKKLAESLEGGYHVPVSREGVFGAGTSHQDEDVEGSLLRHQQADFVQGLRKKGITQPRHVAQHLVKAGLAASEEVRNVSTLGEVEQKHRQRSSLFQKPKDPTQVPAFVREGLEPLKAATTKKVGEQTVRDVYKAARETAESKGSYEFHKPRFSAEQHVAHANIVGRLMYPEGHELVNPRHLETQGRFVATIRPLTKTMDDLSRSVKDNTKETKASAKSTTDLTKTVENPPVHPQVTPNEPTRPLGLPFYPKKMRPTGGLNVLPAGTTPIPMPGPVYPQVTPTEGLPITVVPPAGGKPPGGGRPPAPPTAGVPDEPNRVPPGIPLAGYEPTRPTPHMQVGDEVSVIHYGAPEYPIARNRLYPPAVHPGIPLEGEGFDIGENENIQRRREERIARHNQAFVEKMAERRPARHEMVPDTQGIIPRWAQDDLVPTTMRRESKKERQNRRIREAGGTRAPIGGGMVVPPVHQMAGDVAKAVVNPFVRQEYAANVRQRALGAILPADANIPFGPLPVRPRWLQRQFPTFGRFLRRGGGGNIPVSSVDPLDIATMSPEQLAAHQAGAAGGQRGIGGRVRGFLGKMGGGGRGGAGLAAAFIGAQFLPSLMGSGEPNMAAVNPSGFRRQQSIGGAVAGASMGALAGSVAGPWGMAIGAAIGGLHGFVSSLKEAEQQIHELKIGKDLGELDSVLNDVMSGKLDPERGAGRVGGSLAKLDKDFAGTDKRPIEDRVFSRSGLLGSQGWLQRQIGGTGTAVGHVLNAAVGEESTVGHIMGASDKMLGRGETPEEYEQRRKAERQKFVQEHIAPRLGAIKGNAEAIAKNLKFSDPDLLRTTDEHGNILSPEERDKRRQARIEEFNKRGGRELGKSIVEATPGATQEGFEREMDKLIIEANQEATAHKNLTSALAAQHAEVQKFSRIGQAVDATVAHFQNLQRGTDALEAAFNSQLHAAPVQSHIGALQNVGGLDTPAFNRGVDFVTAGLQGGGPSSLIQSFGKHAKGINQAAGALPQAIADATTDGSLEPGSMSGKVVDNLGKDIPDIIKERLRTLMDAMDPAEIAKQAGENVQKLADDLIKDGFANVNEVLTNASKALEENANKFTADLVKNREMVSKIGEAQDKHVSLQVRALQSRANVQAEIAGRPGQAELSTNTLMQPSEYRLRRLTGMTGTQARNPQAIGARLRGVNAQIASTSQARDEATDPQQINAASEQLVQLQSSAQNLTQALERLADPVEENAILQEKLNRIEASRNSKLGFVEKMATASPAEQFQMRRNAQFSDIAVSQGSLTGLHPEIARGALEHLSSLGEAELPGYGGRKASDVHKQLLVSTGLQAGVLNPEDERKRVGIMQQMHGNDQTAVAAQAELVRSQTSLQQAFFTKLQSNQSEFLNKLATQMLEAQKKDAGSMKATATAELGKAQKAGQAVDFFSKLGMSPAEAKAAHGAGLTDLQDLTREQKSGRKRTPAEDAELSNKIREHTERIGSALYGDSTQRTPEQQGTIMRAAGADPMEFGKNFKAMEGFTDKKDVANKTVAAQNKYTFATQLGDQAEQESAAVRARGEAARRSAQQGAASQAVPGMTARYGTDSPLGSPARLPVGTPPAPQALLRTNRDQYMAQEFGFQAVTPQGMQHPPGEAPTAARDFHAPADMGMRSVGTGPQDPVAGPAANVPDLTSTPGVDVTNLRPTSLRIKPGDKAHRKLQEVMSGATTPGPLMPDWQARRKAADVGLGLPLDSPLIPANTPEVGPPAEEPSIELGGRPRNLRNRQRGQTMPATAFAPGVAPLQNALSAMPIPQVAPETGNVMGGDATPQADPQAAPQAAPRLRKRLVDVLRERPDLAPTSLHIEAGDAAHQKLGQVMSGHADPGHLMPDMRARRQAAAVGLGLPLDSPLIPANTPEVGEPTPEPSMLARNQPGGRSRSLRRQQRLAQAQAQVRTGNAPATMQQMGTQPVGTGPQSSPEMPSQPANPMQEFSKTLQNVASVFSNVHIPDKISLEHGRLEVILNGAQLLASIQGSMGEYVREEIKKQIDNLKPQIPGIMRDAPPSG